MSCKPVSVLVVLGVLGCGAGDSPTDAVESTSAALLPASGAEGLHARALLRADGLTSLELRTLPFDAPGDPPGTIERVQVRFGVPASVLNFHRLDAAGGFATSIPDVARGTRLQVQAAVRGSSASLAILTAEIPVLLSPDLRVSAPSPITSALVGIPVPVRMLVAEHNGDSGATVTCVATVDGVEAQRLEAYFLGAGQQAPCDFTLTFAQPGARTVTLAASADPGDWNAADNAVSIAVDVSPPEIPLAVGQVDGLWSPGALSYNLYGRPDAFPEFSAEAGDVLERSSGSSEELIVQARDDTHALVFPVQATVVLSAGGRELLRLAGEVPAPGPSGCSYLSLGGGAVGALTTCPGSSAQTFVRFSHRAVRSERFHGERATWIGPGPVPWEQYTPWSGLVAIPEQEWTEVPGYSVGVLLGFENTLDLSIRLTSANGTLHYLDLHLDARPQAFTGYGMVRPLGEQAYVYLLPDYTLWYFGD
jgi:hypothetical protein